MLASLAVVLVLSGGPCHAQSDDFDDGDDLGWSRYDPNGNAEFSAVGGEYGIRIPGPGAFGAARAAAYRPEVTYTDFCVVVDIVGYDASLKQAIGIIARAASPGVGTTRGYVFTYQPHLDDNDVQINLVTGEEPTAISPAAGLVPSPGSGTTLRMVFLGSGDYLEGRVYAISDLLNPLAVAWAYDPTYSAGNCGVVVSDFSAAGNGAVDATFDNYFANDGTAPQPLITRTAPGELTLTWPDYALCWQPQTATKLPTGLWTDVTTGITHEASEGRFAYAVSLVPAEPQRFWRLWFPDGT